MVRAMSADTMKMPEPIIEPTTTIVESYRPRPRVNSVSSVVAEEKPGLAIWRSCIKMPSDTAYIKRCSRRRRFAYEH